jgi:tRNA/tmRNA/rRNA uracil-C5-methylase (TrmA/RlmC/RlmD family)
MSLLPVAVTGVAAGGDGLGRLDDGRVVFCEGGLPGEMVAVEITDSRRDFARARVVEVRSASPARVDPPCPHVARGCGGCTWQHVAAGHQPALKVAIVTDALRRLAHLPDAPVTAGAAVPMEGYRTSARLAVDPGGRASYRRRRGHDTVEVDSCLVAHPLLEELIVSGRFPGATEVVLRVGARTGERLASPDRLAAGGKGRGRADVPPGTHVGRRSFVHEEIAGRRWRFSAASFAQTGPEAADLLVVAVGRAARGASGPILDLYAGVGVLGGSLAASDEAWDGLVAVEGSVPAIADARANLADVPHARVVGGDVAEALATGPLEGFVPGIVIADPSRSGLGPGVVDGIATLGPPVVVLVSCDPAALGRDAGLLVRSGYALERVEVLDLFPGTFHVECVSRLVRK